MSQTFERSFIADMLEPMIATLTPVTARPLAEMKVNPTIQARVDALAAKANEGELTDAERSEYESYVRLGNILGFVKARSRKMLSE